MEMLKGECSVVDFWLYLNGDPWSSVFMDLYNGVRGGAGRGSAFASALTGAREVTVQRLTENPCRFFSPLA